jgi:aryl-alcohol dehydrogenase-like predicted oxidoreductase
MTGLTLGETTLTRIGLGTNRLSNTPANVQFVREAVAAGVNMIDTAHIYTGGESEATLGDALVAGATGRLVATKGGYSAAEAEPDALRAQIAESLRRLRSERIELYYLHRIHPEVPLERSLAILAEHRDAGRIGHVGISEASVEQIERARAIVPIAAVQNHYNLTERRHEEVVDYCAAAGIIFVPSSHCAVAALRSSMRSRLATGRPRARSSSRGCCGARQRRCRSRGPCRSHICARTWDHSESSSPMPSSRL